MLSGEDHVALVTATHLYKIKYSMARPSFSMVSSELNIESLRQPLCSISNDNLLLANSEEIQVRNIKSGEVFKYYKM